MRTLASAFFFCLVSTGLQAGSLLGVNHVPPNSDLILIDPMTGAATTVGPLGYETVTGLALDPISGVLYATEIIGDRLLSVDPSTGAAAVVGDLGFGGVGGISFNSAGTLYGVNFATELVTIDTASGVAAHAATLGTGIFAIAFDPTNGTLYGTDFSGQLSTIDPITGIVTPVGSIGFNGVAALVFDPDTHILYGADANTDQLLQVNIVSGAGTAVGPSGFGGANGGVTGLAFVPVPEPSSIALGICGMLLLWGSRRHLRF